MDSPPQIHNIWISNLVLYRCNWRFCFVILGETYTAEDGCNTCHCTRMPDDNLVPTCTIMMCPEPENQCTANGVTYQEGRYQYRSGCYWFSCYTWKPITALILSRFASSQWETALLCNDVFHWLGSNLESALHCEHIHIDLCSFLYKDVFHWLGANLESALNHVLIHFDLMFISLIICGDTTQICKWF